jgi:hypothetical protein
MFQTEYSNIEQRISQLSTVINNKAAVLPIFVRFQKADQYLVLPVVKIDCTCKMLEVTTEAGAMHSINIEQLDDIVAFSDRNGKPVFLTEFSTGADFVTEYQAEVEKENALGLSLAIRHQYEYLRKQRPCSKRQPAISAQGEYERGNIENDSDGLPMAA